MKSLTLTKAFAHYSAKLKNVRWAYSAIVPNGPMVVSCWSGYLRPKGTSGFRYEVNDFSRWSSNPIGKKLLKEHLSQALRGGLQVRMVLAEQENPKAVIAGVDGSKIRKTIRVRDDLVGSVVELTDKRFVIDFRKV
jgi:hypothetical protein